MKKAFLLPLLGASLVLWAASPVKAGQASTGSQEYLIKKGVHVPDSVRWECEAAGSAFSVCPELLEAIAWRESRFDPAATNGRNVGLMQMHRTLHADRLAAYGMDEFDVHAQVWAAAGLLSDLASKYAIDGEEADAAVIVAAYHGEGNLTGESGYVTEVLEVSSALERVHGK